MLYDEICRFLRDLAERNPAFFGDPTALPKRGRRGFSRVEYAEWAVRYAHALEAHGKGYLAWLPAESPGETRANAYRKIERAEALGLCIRRNEHGKRARVELTPFCHQVLSEERATTEAVAHTAGRAT